jgi:hypothetical protein
MELLTILVSGQLKEVKNIRKEPSFDSDIGSNNKSRKLYLNSILYIKYIKCEFFN